MTSINRFNIIAFFFAFVNGISSNVTNSLGKTPNPTIAMSDKDDISITTICFIVVGVLLFLSIFVALFQYFRMKRTPVSNLYTISKAHIVESTGSNSIGNSKLSLNTLSRVQTNDSNISKYKEQPSNNHWNDVTNTKNTLAVAVQGTNKSDNIQNIKRSETNETQESTVFQTAMIILSENVSNSMLVPGYLKENISDQTQYDISQEPYELYQQGQGYLKEQTSVSSQASQHRESTLNKNNVNLAPEFGTSPNDKVRTFSIEETSDPYFKNTFTANFSMMMSKTMVDLNGKHLALPGHLSVTEHDYKLNECIAEGGGGAVYTINEISKELAMLSQGRKLIAKRMRKENEEDHERFIQEVSIMSMFSNHGNFAEFVGYNDELHILIMVFYDYGTLTTWVNSKKSKSLYEAFKIFKGIVSPVMALHCYGIVHNDIKPANILLSVEPDGNLCPKLTDFGISQIVDSTTLKVKAFKSSHVEGWSTRYCPPEKLAQISIKGFDDQFVGMFRKGGDVYSIGVVLYEMLTQKLSWVDNN